MESKEIKLKRVKDLTLFYYEIRSTYKDPKKFDKQFKKFRFKKVGLNNPSPEFIKMLNKVAKNRKVNKTTNINVKDSLLIASKLEGKKFVDNDSYYTIIKVQLEVISIKQNEKNIVWVSRVIKEPVNGQIIDIILNELMSESEILELQSDLIINIISVVIDNYSKNEVNEKRKKEIAQNKKQKQKQRNDKRKGK